MEYKTVYHGITSGKRIHAYRGENVPFVPPLGSYIHIDINGVLEGKIAHINTKFAYTTIIDIFVEEYIDTKPEVISLETYRNGTEG